MCLFSPLSVFPVFTLLPRVMPARLAADSALPGPGFSKENQQLLFGTVAMFQLFGTVAMVFKAQPSVAPAVPQHRIKAPHHPPAAWLFTAGYFLLKIWSQGAKSLLCLSPVLTSSDIVFRRLQEPETTGVSGASRCISIFGL